MALRELHLFAGAGGGILGGILLGHEPVCAVELEAYPRSVLLQRQRDGILPWFPVWDDVCTFDGRPWAGRVDVICGGFPCQDISSAGKGAGIEGSRSGLWSEFARIIGEVRPRYVFVENSPLLTSRGLHRVLGDLAALGFDAEWGCIPAAFVGAPQARDRIWIIAHPREGRWEGITEWDCRRKDALTWDHYDGLALAQHRAREASSRIRRMDDAVARGVDRLEAIGNGQVPAVAALAWRILEQRLNQPI